MINENTSFKQYLKESGFSLMQYQEEVYNTCLAKNDKYYNIDVYFKDEIEKGFNENVPAEQLADELCENFDKCMEDNLVETSLRDLPTCKFCISITPYKGNGVIKYATAPAHISSLQKLKEMMENRLNMDLIKDIVVYPDPYNKIKLSDEPVSDLDESTEEKKESDDGLTDGETFTEWKENVFKYIDKRVDVDKIKELGTYIKDFIKQEYDNGEPSWFNVAESVVNYARMKFPQAIKPRESNAFSITENKTNEARISNKQRALEEIQKYFGIFGKSPDGDTIYPGTITREDEIEIGNICDKYNVDFALGSKHVTVFDKTRNEAFIQDDRGKVSINDLVSKIMDKAGLVVDMEDDYTAAAYYIADFYSKQSLPINGMVMWGSRDLLKFKRIYDEQIQNANTSEEIQEYEKKAVTSVRSIMLGNPGKKWVWIEEIKAQVRNERKAAEEQRRQDYLNSEEHRHMNDPGWRGPNGTWSND